MDSWFNSRNPNVVFRESISQNREFKISPQKGQHRETWKKHIFDSSRKPVTKNFFNSWQPVAKNLFDSPRKPVAKNSFGSSRKPVAKRAVKSIAEYSPRPTKKMTVYFENINGEICLTKVKPENLVRWKLLKKKYWPLHYHSAITNKRTVISKISDMKTHKTIQITLTKLEAQPYMNGKYIDVPNKPKPKTENKATPSKVVNKIRYETNNYYNHSAPSTSSYDQIKYDDRQEAVVKSEDYSDDNQDEYEDYSDDDSQDESGESEESCTEDSQDEYSEPEDSSSYIYKESRKTNNVYWN